MSAAQQLTRALVLRHAAGRADTYDAALLDVAQDHLLWLLDTLGMFAGTDLVFKGGTSLRKCRLGNKGRFSTDLDFVAPNDDTVLETCEVIDGASVGGFNFGLTPTRGDGRHWNLSIRHGELGTPNIAASVEFARRAVVRTPERPDFIELPIHRAYGIDLPSLPVVAEAEACAEKLARYRRVSLGRDVYDLAQFATRPIDEALVRRLWVLKVWEDVVDDRRGDKPLDPDDVLRVRKQSDFAPDSIGKLTQPVDLMGWEAAMRRRFAFLVQMDDDEIRWSACDPRHRLEIQDAIAGGTFDSE